MQWFASLAAAIVLCTNVSATDSRTSRREGQNLHSWARRGLTISCDAGAEQKAQLDALGVTIVRDRKVQKKKMVMRNLDSRGGTRLALGQHVERSLMPVQFLAIGQRHVSASAQRLGEIGRI